MRKVLSLADINFEKLIEDVQNLSRQTAGIPDVYCLIVQSLFGPIDDGVLNDEYVFAGDCLYAIIEMGYGVQELMPVK